jgi:hypothetical protein
MARSHRSLKLWLAALLQTLQLSIRKRLWKRLRMMVKMEKEQRLAKVMRTLMKMRRVPTKLMEEIAHPKLQLRNWPMMPKQHRRSSTSNYVTVFVASLNTTKTCSTSTLATPASTW